MTGAVALTVFVAGAGLAAIALFGIVAFRQAGLSGGLWRGGLILVGALSVWALLDRYLAREFVAERRAVATMATEITVRAIAPGSALACLDAVASAQVEAACERSLFATPEAVAAAVAYVDAKIGLLAATIALADRDPTAQSSLERLRRGLEVDRFGIVAHVLKTRGCNPPDCAELKLLRDTGRVLTNIKTRAFDTHVAAHAAAWPSPSNPAVVATPSPAVVPAPSYTAAGVTAAVPSTAPTLPGMPGPPVTSNAAPPPKYDFPSSDSIPAVSIMNPEPSSGSQVEPRPAATAPRRAPPQSAPRQPPREQPKEQPLSVVPQAAAPAGGQTTGAR